MSVIKHNPVFDHAYFPLHRLIEAETLACADNASAAATTAASCVARNEAYGTDSGPVWTYMDPARLQPDFGKLWSTGHNCRRISGFLVRLE